MPGGGGLLYTINTLLEQLVHEYGRATTGAITVGILFGSLGGCCCGVCMCFKLLRCCGFWKTPPRRAIRPPPLPAAPRRYSRRELLARYSRCEPIVSEVAMIPLPPLPPQSPQPPPPLLPPPPAVAGPSGGDCAGRFTPEAYAASPNLAQPSLPPLPPPPPPNAAAPAWASDAYASPFGCGAHGAPAPGQAVASSAGGFDRFAAADCARRGEATDYV